MKRVCFFLLLVALNSACQNAVNNSPIRVGSKHFTEGYLLSEMIALLIEQEGFAVERRFHLGGTMVCFSALEQGEIDLYPEYTGTIFAEIFKLPGNIAMDSLTKILAQQTLGMSGSYGFENTYALVMTRKQATQLSIHKISDLTSHPTLRMGLSYEFLKRQDGWESLASAYGLRQSTFGLEHGLAYAALQQERMDVTDAYSTDGEISFYDLVVLADDKQYFPDYQAVSLYRKEIPARAIQAAHKLVGRISETEIQGLNAEVLFNKRSFEEVAKEFLLHKKLIDTSEQSSPSLDILHKTLTHLKLTFIALLLSVAVAIPLSVFVYWYGKVAPAVIYATGLLQTIPSIALLAVLIPITGIGALPAVIALFLYGLLPILRNTVTGLRTIDPSLKKLADGIGMTQWQKLRYVELPLAAPAILSGIRTAAVINIGTATLAAFIGAGGLGEFIVTGLALNNYELILTGALPAAALAILVELFFEIVQRLVIPKYFRPRS
ncbi:MAG TPA: glycine betaine ABC transporter substrate-binding protein [Chryseolinea sp.]|nr:glycine betaine ABC transporter substrate-binding protein [Chryseolinea sp.]